jgi:hypothetical protein
VELHHVDGLGRLATGIDRKLNPRVSAPFPPPPQVTCSTPTTLSRWRHGFEPRWDYKHKAPGQGTSPESVGRLNHDSNAEYPENIPSQIVRSTSMSVTRRKGGGYTGVACSPAASLARSASRRAAAPGDISPDTASLALSCRFPAPSGAVYGVSGAKTPTRSRRSSVVLVDEPAENVAPTGPANHRPVALQNSDTSHTALRSYS